MGNRGNHPTDRIVDGDTSPYGPQHGQIDEASGGADSSPLENLSSDEKAQALKEGQNPSLYGPASGVPTQVDHDGAVDSDIHDTAGEAE